MQKELIYSPPLRTNHDSFYNYFLQLLVNGNVSLMDAKIRLDGSGGKDFERALKTYLRQKGEIKIDDFRMVDSRRDQLAQLADMCVGAIARCHREQRDDRRRWYSMLEKRIANVWVYR